MTALTLLYDKPFAKIEYIAAQNLIKVVWFGFVTLPYFKETLNQLLIALANYPTVGLILSNQTQRKVLTQDEISWFAQEFAPKFLQSRTVKTKLAIVKSEDVFGVTSTATAMNKVSPVKTVGLSTYQYFDSEFEAMQWLLGEVG
jgi:hypothetical protein